MSERAWLLHPSTSWPEGLTVTVSSSTVKDALQEARKKFQWRVIAQGPVITPSTANNWCFLTFYDPDCSTAAPVHPLALALGFGEIVRGEMLMLCVYVPGGYLRAAFRAPTLAGSDSAIEDLPLLSSSREEVAHALMDALLQRHRAPFGHTEHHLLSAPPPLAPPMSPPLPSPALLDGAERCAPFASFSHLLVLLTAAAGAKAMPSQTCPLRHPAGEQKSSQTPIQNGAAGLNRTGRPLTVPPRENGPLLPCPPPPQQESAHRGDFKRAPRAPPEDDELFANGSIIAVATAPSDPSTPPSSFAAGLPACTPAACPACAGVSELQPGSTALCRSCLQGDA